MNLIRLALWSYLATVVCVVMAIVTTPARPWIAAVAVCAAITCALVAVEWKSQRRERA